MTTGFPEWKNELPSFPHKLLDDPLRKAVEYRLEHLRRDAQDGKIGPFKAWLVLRGLLLAAMQNYASVCILLSSKRPKPLMLQAGILNRSSLEILVNVSALLEDFDRIDILNLESFKDLALRYQSEVARHGRDPKWTKFLAVFRTNLESSAKVLGVDEALIDSPGEINEKWPTPGLLIFGDSRRKIDPLVSGNRQGCLATLYRRHYPHQSALAHQRIAAVSSAMLVDSPEMQWNPGHGESNIVVDAIMFLACILSELQAAGGYPAEPKLLEVWTYLREVDEDAKELWALRYEQVVNQNGT